MQHEGIWWPDRPLLRQASRLARWPARSRFAAVELVAPIVAGIVAALAVTLIDLPGRIPGRAILKATLPVVAALAATPRGGAGLLTSGSAALTLVMLKQGWNASAGWGATTSLLALGPLLDLAARGKAVGWVLHARIAAAGLAANLVAFAIRGGSKGLGLDALGTRPWSEWLTVAPWSYSACGVVAGLASAAIFFSHRQQQRGDAACAQ